MFISNTNISIKLHNKNNHHMNLSLTRRVLGNISIIIIIIINHLVQN